MRNCQKLTPIYYTVHEVIVGGIMTNHFIAVHLTENPFLRLNMGLVTVTGSADMFNITVMGAYTASDGVSLRPTLEDYSLVYFLGGEAVAVQDLVVVMDLNRYEQ